MAENTEKDFKNKHGRVVYDEDIPAVVTNFVGFHNLEDFKLIAEKELEFFRRFEVTKCMVNLKEMEVMKTENQQYIQETWFSEAAALGIKFIAFVVPEDIFGAETMRQTNEDAESRLSMNMEYFYSPQDAIDWLKKQ